MRAVLGCNLAVVDGLSAIFGRHLAVVDGPHSAVRSLCASRGRQDPFVCRALTVVRRAIPCGAVEIANRVVTSFSLLVAQPGRNVTVLCSQPGLATANRRQLVGPGILAVLRRLRPIFGCHLAIVDRSNPAVRSLSTPRVRPSTFVCRALPAARRAIARGSIAISRRVVTRFGFLVTELGGDIPLPRSQPRLPSAPCCQLVGPGILAILGGLRAIVRCNPAVVDGSHATVRSLGATRCGSGTFVCRATAVAGRAISRGAVEIACRIVTAFRFPVTKFGRDIPRARSQRGIFAIPGGLYAIFGRKLAVIDGLGAVVRSLRASRGGLRTFVRRVLTIARRASPGGSVEITSRVVTRFGLPVTQPGGNVTVLRSQPGLSAAHSRLLVGPGIQAVLGGVGAIFGRNSAIVNGLRAVVRGSSAPRGGLHAFVSRVLSIARRSIPGGSVEITSRVVARFCLSVTQPGCDVTVLRGQPGLTAAHSSQLVGPGIFAVLGGLCPIFGRHLAVVDGLGAVVRSLSVPRGTSVTFAVCMLTLACGAVPCGSVEITGRIVTCFGLSISLLGLAVTHVRG